MGKAKGAVSNVKKVMKSEKPKASVTETKTYKIGKGKAGKGEGKTASGSRSAKEKKNQGQPKDTEKKKETQRNDKKNDKGKKALQVESTETTKKRVSAIKVQLELRNQNEGFLSSQVLKQSFISLPCLPIRLKPLPQRSRWFHPKLLHLVPQQRCRSNRWRCGNPRLQHRV